MRQRGLHVTTQEGSGERHEVIPLRDPARAKTLPGILKSVARQHGCTGPSARQVVSFRKATTTPAISSWARMIWTIALLTTAST